ncbi:hypothetical protein ACF08A_25785 [Streptomyces cellulosae]
MYDLAPSNAPWFEHLTDSVRALGYAALEWQHAARAAAVEHGRFANVDNHEGKVLGTPAPDAPAWQSESLARRPHMLAVFELRTHYLNAMQATARGYLHAALVFASGAAWAVRQVQEGQQPSRVVMPMDATTRRTLVPGPTYGAGFGALEDGRYAGSRRLAGAFNRLTDCLHAGQVAEQLAEQDYLPDHEAAELHDLLDVAEGTADAAYAYGLLVEGALQFVLLGPKDAHHKATAEARAAAAVAAAHDRDAAAAEGGAPGGAEGGAR